MAQPPVAQFEQSHIFQLFLWNFACVCLVWRSFKSSSVKATSCTQKQLRIKKRDRFSFINCAYHLLQPSGVLKCDVTSSDRSANFSILHPSSVRPSSLAICLSWRLYQRRHKVSHGQEDVLRLLCAYCKYYIMCLRVKKHCAFLLFPNTKPP